MHLPDVSVYQRMATRQAIPRLDEREMRFPGGVGHVQVSREQLAWQVPGQRDGSAICRDISDALPVKAGDEYYVACAEHQRALTWFDAAGSIVAFDVGSPITGLYGAEAVYAVGRNGAVLTVEPGAAVESDVPLPRSLLDGGQPEGGQIVAGESTVSIGGIVVARRR
jgi:hypothetical protein